MRFKKMISEITNGRGADGVPQNLAGLYTVLVLMSEQHDNGTRPYKVSGAKTLLCECMAQLQTISPHYAYVVSQQSPFSTKQMCEIPGLD